MIQFHRPDIGYAERAAVMAALESGWLTTGRMAERFETEFAERLEVGEALAVSSATMAALLIFEAVGIRPGDEVVFPAWTFSGPAMMAHKLGAKVVLCDVDPNTLCMTAETLEPALSSRTKLVIPTHFAGLPIDLDPLIALGKRRGFRVVDDAAHALPAWDDQARQVGSQGSHATFFSFYATKTVTSGEGGMIVGVRAVLDRIRRSRMHGISRDVFDRYTNPETGWHYDVTGEGWKANLPDMLAALGRAQLGRVMQMRDRRAEIARSYRSAMLGLPTVIQPVVTDGHSWHLYVLRITGQNVPGPADFIEQMAARGVQCSRHFIPLHHHGFWARHAAKPGPLTNCDTLFKQVVSLPIYSGMTAAEAGAVITHATDLLTP